MQTLFDNKSYKVLSASRMTDMPKYYPKEIIAEVYKRIKSGINLHTLVLWTKFPGAVLNEPLNSFLHDIKYRGTQLYIQLTVTGMGKLVIGETSDGNTLIPEPFAPSYQESVNLFPELIELVGKAERIRLRIDPIIRIKDAKGKEFSSLCYFPTILKEASKLEIRTISFSFLEAGIHKKVDARMRKMGCEILSPTKAEREKTKTWFKKLENENNVKIYSCCVPGFRETRCIDGYLFEELHDQKLPIGKEQPRKRELCGCTESIDIGGWPPKRCYTGCIYCYANVNLKDNGQEKIEF